MHNKDTTTWTSQGHKPRNFQVSPCNGQLRLITLFKKAALKKTTPTGVVLATSNMQASAASPRPMRLFLSTKAASLRRWSSLWSWMAKGLSSPSWLMKASYSHSEESAFMPPMGPQTSLKITASHVARQPPTWTLLLVWIDICTAYVNNML